MSALRTLSLVLAFTAAVGMIFGTAGFTAIEADRGLAVNVTDDESAYLGYEPLTDEVHDGQSAAVVEYRNQFGSEIDEFDVDVSIRSHGPTGVTIQSVGSPSSLDRGTAAPVNVTLRCDERETVPILFEVDGNGGGVGVSLDRVHEVTCVPKDPRVTGIRYTGVGNAFVDVEGQNATVEAIVWLTDANPGKSNPDVTLRSEAVSELDTSKPVRPQIAANVSNERMAVIEFPEQDVAFFHPGWNGEKHADPREGDGVRFSDVPLDGDTVSNTSVIDD